jgi:hypothetical protein
MDTTIRKRLIHRNVVGVREVGERIFLHEESTE